MTGTMGKVAGLPDEPALIYKINSTITSGLSIPGTILQHSNNIHLRLRL